MVDINEILKDLAKQRPLFHSEADFQHAFAWKIHEQLPNAAVRLELPFEDHARKLHLDVWISNGDEALAIELKYKTRAIETRVQDEDYSLQSHSAQDLGRYDFIKDMVRLEQITTARPGVVGYAIFLTNDSAYWSAGARSNVIYAAFRLEEGIKLQGTLAWGKGASEGTMRDRETPLALGGIYKIHWQDYSQVPGKSYNQLRFACVPVRHQ